MPTFGGIFGRNSLMLVRYSRARILRRGLAAATISSFAALSVSPLPARGDAISDKKAQAAALAEQIDAQGRQVEVLAEQYNGAQYHLAQVQQQLADAQQRLSQAEADADRDRLALSQEAIVAYMHGGVTASPTLKSINGGVDLAVQEGYFQLATNNQADALDQLRKSQQALKDQQQALQVAKQDSEASLASVAQRQRAVEAASAASQATLNQVQGDLVSLVADQQAQIQAKQQAQAQASFAAKGEVAGSAAAASSPASSTTVAPPGPQAGSASASTVDGTGGGGAATTSDTSATTAPAPPTTPRPTVAPTTTPPTTVAPAPQPTKAPPPSSGAGAAIAYARAQLGKPYQWGAAGPNSFDCSGLTMMAWEAGGVSLPHYTAAQYADTAHVAIADLQPGDLVFFGSDLHHVGLYIGGGQMIDAPRTGENVKIQSIYWPDLQPYGGRPS
jgi:cell wall-associated NlpC family hydrolase